MQVRAGVEGGAVGPLDSRGDHRPAREAGQRWKEAEVGLAQVGGASVRAPGTSSEGRVFCFGRLAGASRGRSGPSQATVRVKTRSKFANEQVGGGLAITRQPARPIEQVPELFGRTA